MSIKITDKALLEIKRVMEEQNIPTSENVLEVGVVGGGCSGFSYKLGFKNKTEIDALNSTTFSFQGLDAVVDNKCMIYLEGATVDFHDSIDKRGFVFDNPNSKGGCGCGQSFKA